MAAVKCEDRVLFGGQDVPSPREPASHMKRKKLAKRRGDVAQSLDGLYMRYTRGTLSLLVRARQTLTWRRESLELRAVG